MSNVIPGHFPQAPAVRCIIKDENADVVDFVAIKVARQVCVEEEIELIARLIAQRVKECRDLIEQQERQFSLYGRADE